MDTPRLLDRCHGPLGDGVLAVAGVLCVFQLGPTAVPEGTTLPAAVCARQCRRHSKDRRGDPESHVGNLHRVRKSLDADALAVSGAGPAGRRRRLRRHHRGEPARRLR